MNDPTVHDEAQMPLGGVKPAGIGHVGGKAGIAEFTDLRWITVHPEEQPRQGLEVYTETLPLHFI